MGKADKIEVVRGIPEGSRAEVASLYWEAFGQKLAPSLGDRDRGERYLETQLWSDNFFCALSSGRVVGVLGFHGNGHAAVGLSLRELAREYSVFSAPWRAALQVVLGRAPAAGQLLLDGLSVSADARGGGIGSRLLDEALSLAKSRGLREVRLSVVDSNPRARALYERLGFVPTGSVSMGPLGAVFGFRRSTDMVFRFE